jgi:hypothetical protein
MSVLLMCNFLLNFLCCFFNFGTVSVIGGVILFQIEFLISWTALLFGSNTIKPGHKRYYSRRAILGK